MRASACPSFFTLLILISFASVNAVLFTPALPDIAQFFSINIHIAQQTVTWFLIGYTLGQLIYGPLANRFGRKLTLYAGVSLQIISSFICALAGIIHLYTVLVLGCFLLALGSGVGLKMAFTLASEYYDPSIASEKISYMTLAFAITPGLAMALGGVLNTHYGWTSCFYAGAVYGLLLLLLLTRLPEPQKVLSYDALKLSHLTHEYGVQFRNVFLIAGGLLMGGSTCMVYVFAAVAPFIAIDLFGMNSTQYGLANIIPSIGLLLGSLFSAKLSRKYSSKSIILTGVLISTVGVILMIFAVLIHLPVLFSLFLSMIIVYFGSSLVLANASSIAMNQASDKAHGSAVINFISMGLATLAVLSLPLFSINIYFLPLFYLILCIVMVGVYQWLARQINAKG